MTTQYEVIEAEENLKRAKAARAKEVQEEWKQKTREIAREARAAKNAFLKAKAQFADAKVELDALSRKQQQIEIDLHLLEENFRLLEIPLPEEEESYASEKERLNGQLLKFMKPPVWCWSAGGRRGMRRFGMQGLTPSCSTHTRTPRHWFQVPS